MSQVTPAHAMNMTPLIDVLLVLLVIFILSVPAATHTLPVDLPSKCEDCTTSPIANTLSIDRNDRLAWNGTAIDRSDLAGLLAGTLRLAVEPELRFAPSERSSYRIAAETMAAIKASGVTRFGFVGNERFRSFASAR